MVNLFDKLDEAGLKYEDPGYVAMLKKGAEERAQAGKPPICKGFFLPSEYLMQVYEAEKEAEKKDKKKAGKEWIRDSVQAAEVHVSIPALETLRKIELSQIVKEVNKIHWDRVLYATVVTSPFKTVSVQIMIRDQHDQICRLCIYNSGGDHTKLTRGTRLAVLAPYMKHARDDSTTGVVMLRCDNPKGVIFFESETQWKEAMELQGTGRKAPEPRGNFSFHKSRGNVSFGAGSFLQAIASYTSAFDVADSDADRLSVLSNRSQCYLNVRAYPEALADAESALSLDASHVKSAYRKATACFWLRRPSDILAICASPLVKETKANMKQFSPLAEDARRAERQMKGDYDLTAMTAAVQGGVVKGSYLDYAHPSIRIGSSPVKGRVAFASTNIEAGELLMVCKAFGSHQQEATAREVDRVLNMKFYGDDTDDKFAAVLCTKLEGMLPGDRSLFFSLSAGDNAALSVGIVNAEIARMNNLVVVEDASCDEGREKEVCPTVEGMRDRVIKIIRSNAFNTLGNRSELDRKLRILKWTRTLKTPPTSAELELYVKEGDRGSCSAIFILPSLFNHSCCANATYSTIGDFIIVRTIRRVSQGDELTVPYLDAKKHYYHRKKTLAQWIGTGDGFTCDCERCVPIAAIGETLSQRIARADTEAFLRDAYDKIASLVVDGTMSKDTAIKRVISSDKFSAIKSEAEKLPVSNQDALSVLLEFELGKYCESGNVTKALFTARQLAAILDVIGSVFDVLKHKLLTLGLVFYAGEGSAAAIDECRTSLRSARELSYPEIDRGSAGNADFQLICDSYCFMVRNHSAEDQLRRLIRDCML